jgi:hypothetical protein
MANPAEFLEAIDGLGVALREFHNRDSTQFSAKHGVGAPPLDAEDLAVTVESFAARVRAFDWEGADSRSQTIFDDLAQKAAWVSANAVPNLQGSNTANSIISFLTSADAQVFSSLTPEVLATSRRLPSNLKKDVARATQRLKAALDGVEDIESSIEKINQAYHASERLDTTIEDLESALRIANESKGRIEGLEDQIRASTSSADGSAKHLSSVEKRAEDTMSRVNAAFRAATSHGLADAFRRKASWLNASMYVWAAILLGALWLAIGIGADRFPLILAALSNQSELGLNWGLLIMQVVLAAFSLGAPVWVAWVATKQIGQRFRLAEDYAYKAALSAAYEGYRSEAAELDPLLKAQLFSIALTRLDEIPLRLIEQHVAGSPLHELLASKEFQEAAKQVPALKDRAMRIINRNSKSETPKKDEKGPEPSTSE